MTVRTVSRVRSLTKPLYFAVLTSSKVTLPDKGLRGCHLVATNDGEQPRIPAFEEHAHAEAALAAARRSHVPYRVHRAAPLRVERIPRDLDVSFVFRGHVSEISDAIGTFVCDLCVHSPKRGIVCKASYCIGDERLDRERLEDDMTAS